jgi:hypothetical protein
MTAQENGRPSAAGYRDGLWHALGEPYPARGGTSVEPMSAPTPGPAATVTRATLCGQVAEIGWRRTGFDPTRADACPACTWWEAIRTDTINTQLARLAAGPRRALAVALAEATLAEAATAGDGVDHPGTVELLAGLTAPAARPLPGPPAGDHRAGPARHDCGRAAILVRVGRGVVGPLAR